MRQVADGRDGMASDHGPVHIGLRVGGSLYCLVRLRVGARRGIASTSAGGRYYWCITQICSGVISKPSTPRGGVLRSSHRLISHPPFVVPAWTHHTKDRERVYQRSTLLEYYSLVPGCPPDRLRQPPYCCGVSAAGGFPTSLRPTAKRQTNSVPPVCPAIGGDARRSPETFARDGHRRPPFPPLPPAVRQHPGRQAPSPAPERPDAHMVRRPPLTGHVGERAHPVSDPDVTGAALWCCALLRRHARDSGSPLLAGVSGTIVTTHPFHRVMRHARCWPNVSRLIIAAGGRRVCCWPSWAC